MSSDDDNAAFCARLARERDFWSYAAGLLVEPFARRAWHALAAFNAEVSQVRDHIQQPLAGEVRLQWWHDVADGLRNDEARGNPVAAELLRVIARHDLPRELLGRLIDAHVFDVYDDPMPDMAALEAHCRDTHGSLYRLSALIGGGNASGPAADHAGIAHGLVAVLLLLPRHTARRQLYLPADLLALHNVLPEQIFAREATTDLAKVLMRLRGEARQQLERAMTLIGDLPVDDRAAFLPLALVRKTLDSLETAAAFEPPQLSRLRILWTLLKASRSQTFSS